MKCTGAWVVAPGTKWRTVVKQVDSSVISFSAQLRVTRDVGPNPAPTTYSRAQLEAGVEIVVKAGDGYRMDVKVDVPTGKTGRIHTHVTFDGTDAVDDDCDESLCDWQVTVE